MVAQLRGDPLEFRFVNLSFCAWQIKFNHWLNTQSFSLLVPTVLCKGEVGGFSFFFRIYV